MNPRLSLHGRSIVLLLSLGPLACHRQPEFESRPQPVSSGNAEPAPLPRKPRPTEAATLTWTDPPGWSRTPSTSSMRLATYRVPKTAGDTDDAELTVFHFGPNQGGSTESNFERWEKQFTGATKSGRSERTLGGFAGHVLEIQRGTFAAQMPGQEAAPRAGYGLLAVILETPDGPYFFKLTGPEKTLAQARSAFFTLLESVRH